MSVACAPTSMLLPVHTVLVGVVNETFGGVVSMVPVTVPVVVPPDVEPVEMLANPDVILLVPVVRVAFDTVTPRVAVPVPAESVAVAVSVTEPFAELVVFQLTLLLVPV